MNRARPRRGIAIAMALAVAFLVLAVRAPWGAAALLAFSSMLVFHELAHFVAARRAGMHVSTFAIGLGPRLLTWQRGETEVAVKAFPFGGYNRIVGMNSTEEITPEDEHRTYRSKSWGARVGVALAGPASHVVAAFLLLWCLEGPVGHAGAEPSLVVHEVVSVADGRTPAGDAGVRAGDRVVQVAGRSVDSWDELRGAVLGRPEQPVELVVERDGRLLPLTVVPAAVSDPEASAGESRMVGAIGVVPRYPIVRVGPVRAAVAAGGDLVRVAELTVQAFGTVFGPSGIADLGRQVVGTESGEENGRVLSPLGFVRVADQAGRSDVRNLLVLMVSANLFVALFNLVPLLPFDGGLVALATYERLRSRRGRRHHADVTRLLPLTASVVAAMVLLGLSALWLDAVAPVADPFR